MTRRSSRRYFSASSRGAEIEIGLAYNLLEAAPQLIAVSLVREREAAVEVLAQDVLWQGLDQ